MYFTLLMSLGMIYSGAAVVNPITLTATVRIPKDVDGDCTLSREDLENADMEVHTLNSESGSDTDIINIWEYS